MTDQIVSDPSVETLVSPEEWATRVDLAACYRLMHEYGMEEMSANHLTARIPGKPDEFLLNPYGYLFEEITASSLVTMNLAGDVLLNPLGAPINRSGYVIHSAVYAARPDVNSAIHAHTIAGMAISALKCGLLPLVQTSMRWARDLSYLDYEGIADDPQEGKRLAQELGENSGMIMRNHGILVAAASVPECFNNAFRLERACQVQLAALACGQELDLPSDEYIQQSYENFAARRLGVLEWPALLRKLDRKDKSYRK